MLAPARDPAVKHVEYHRQRHQTAGYQQVPHVVNLQICHGGKQCADTTDGIAQRKPIREMEVANNLEAFPCAHGRTPLLQANLIPDCAKIYDGRGASSNGGLHSVTPDGFQSDFVDSGLAIFSRRLGLNVEASHYFAVRLMHYHDERLIFAGQWYKGIIRRLTAVFLQKGIKLCLIVRTFAR